MFVHAHSLGLPGPPAFVNHPSLGNKSHLLICSMKPRTSDPFADIRLRLCEADQTSFCINTTSPFASISSVWQVKSWLISGIVGGLSFSIADADLRVNKVIRVVKTIEYTAMANILTYRESSAFTQTAVSKEAP